MFKRKYFLMRSETIQEPEDSLGFTDNNEWY